MYIIKFKFKNMYKNNSNPFGGYGFGGSHYIIGSEAKEVITGYKGIKYKKNGESNTVISKTQYDGLPATDDDSSGKDNKTNYIENPVELTPKEYEAIDGITDKKENYTPIIKTVEEPNKYKPEYQGFQNPLAKDSSNYLENPLVSNLNFGKTQEEVFLSNGDNQIYPNMSQYSIFLGKKD